MNQVELIRARIVRGQLHELIKLRQFVSMTEGNNDALELLKDKQLNRLIIDITDMVLRHLGVKVEKPKDGRTRTAKVL